MSETHPITRSQPSRFGAVPTLIGLIVCASLCGMAAFFSCSTGMPTIRSPLPLPVFVSVLLASALGATNPWLVATSIPFGKFLLINFYQLRFAEPAPLRTRFTVLLGLTSVLSVLFFALAWQDGFRFQGVSFTLGTASINFAILIVLWIWWLSLRQKVSKTSALLFATSLHCWLFGYAFPCLGELP